MFPRGAVAELSLDQSGPVRALICWARPSFPGPGSVGEVIGKSQCVQGVCPGRPLGHQGIVPRAFAGGEGTQILRPALLQLPLSSQSSRRPTFPLPPVLGLRRLGRIHVALVRRVCAAQNGASDPPDGVAGLA